MNEAAELPDQSIQSMIEHCDATIEEEKKKPGPHGPNGRTWRRRVASEMKKVLIDIRRKRTEARYGESRA